jgi:purine-cytosine permease-like protein
MKIGNREIRLPQSRLLRILIGLGLIFGGILGFLPILGFWMIPLGFLVLAEDFPVVKRMERRIAAWWRRRREKKRNRS